MAHTSRKSTARWGLRVALIAGAVFVVARVVENKATGGFITAPTNAPTKGRMA